MITRVMRMIINACLGRQAAADKEEELEESGE